MKVLYYVTYFLPFLYMSGNCDPVKFLPPGQFAYFDLTELIDKTLINGSVNNNEDLRTALSRSPFVLYRSDVLLRNIENILPVIDLLHQLKPDERPPQIILSLRYFNRTNGNFNWERLGDIYYNIKSNMTLNDKSKIVNSVGAIAVDLHSGRGIHNFYDSVSYLTEISFPSYIKNFIKLHFGYNVIPVSVMYGDDQMINHNHREERFINKHILSADFVIYCIKFSSFDYSNDFPMFMEKLKSDLADKVKQNTVFLSEIFRKTSRSPINALLQMNITGTIGTSELYPYFSHGDHWSTFNSYMEKTASYNATSQLFLKNAYSKAPNMFTEVVTNWAMQERHNVIISNFHQNFSSETWKETKKSPRQPLILPLINMQETNISLCEMKRNLSTWKEQHDFVVFDERTLRALIRFQQDLEGDVENCNHIHIDRKFSESPASPRLNGILNFHVGVQSIWKQLKFYMTEMLTDYSTSPQISLKTFMFDETDIKSEEIQQFLNVSAQSNFSIGCSMSFNTFRRLYYSSYNQPPTFKEVIEKNVCQPLFHVMDHFVWRVDDDGNYGSGINFKTSGLFSSYSDVFLAREVFMKEYPGKNVLIQFNSERDKKIIAEMYDVPIVVPTTQIRF